MARTPPKKRDPGPDYAAADQALDPSEWGMFGENRKAVATMIPKIKAAKKQNAAQKRTPGPNGSTQGNR